MCAVCVITTVYLKFTACFLNMSYIRKSHCYICKVCHLSKNSTRCIWLNKLLKLLFHAPIDFNACSLETSNVSKLLNSLLLYCVLYVVMYALPGIQLLVSLQYTPEIRPLTCYYSLYTCNTLLNFITMFIIIIILSNTMIIACL